MWSKTCLAGAVCVALTVFSNSSASLAATIPYHVNGALDDGGRFFGTFTLSTEAIDRWHLPDSGLFDLENVDVRLVDTGLFGSGASSVTSGSATEAQLFQRSTTQELLLLFLADDGMSNVFVDGLSFAPFDGDPKIAAPIQGDWTMGGFFDGAGNVDIVSIELTQVPVPAALPLFLGALALLGMVGWRRKQTAAA